MRTIWKFIVPTTAMDPEGAVIEVPATSRILHVDSQSENICIWMEVNDQNPHMRSIYVYVRGTGHQLHGGELRHIGSLKMDDGNLVFHVYTNEV